MRSPSRRVLQDALMARLDRLSGAKQVAQTAAVIGREFSYELLRAVTSISEDELGGALRRLAESELIFQRGDPPQASYTFLRDRVWLKARSNRRDHRTSPSVGVALPYRLPLLLARGAGAASVALARPDLRSLSGGACDGPAARRVFRDRRRSIQAKLPGRFHSRERPPHIGRGRGCGANPPRP